MRIVSIRDVLIFILLLWLELLLLGDEPEFQNSADMLVWLSARTGTEKQKLQCSHKGTKQHEHALPNARSASMHSHVEAFLILDSNGLLLEQKVVLDPLFPQDPQPRWRAVECGLTRWKTEKGGTTVIFVLKLAKALFLGWGDATL